MLMNAESRINSANFAFWIADYLRSLTIPEFSLVLIPFTLYRRVISAPLYVMKRQVLAQRKSAIERLPARFKDNRDV